MNVKHQSGPIQAECKPRTTGRRLLAALLVVGVTAAAAPQSGSAQGVVAPPQHAPAVRAGVEGNRPATAATAATAASPAVQKAYLKASNAGAGDRFGYSVAVDGDTMVVGAL